VKIEFILYLKLSFSFYYRVQDFSDSIRERLMSFAKNVYGVNRNKS
jgi:hypothetical protein